MAEIRQVDQLWILTICLLILKVLSNNFRPVNIFCSTLDAGLVYIPEKTKLLKKLSYGYLFDTFLKQTSKLDKLVLISNASRFTLKTIQSLDHLYSF
jgi:hypothetical protein